MKEVIASFGHEGQLAGTLTLPDESAKPVGLLLLNAGVIQRMGPHRVNVKLARKASEAGFASLRFDLSGLGDSLSLPSKLPFERQAVLDITTAISYLQRTTGIERVVIVGICSGAHHGQTAALDDPRIVGLWMLDGYFYTTTKTLMVRLQRRLSPSAWPTLLPWIGRQARSLWGRLWSRILGRSAGSSDEGVYHFPSRESYARSMNALTERGVDMHLAFSGSWGKYFNYPQQLADGFRGQPFLSRVECEIDPRLDHTLRTLEAQRLMIEKVVGWLDRLCQRMPKRPSGSMTS